MLIDPELYPWISAAAIAWGLLDCFLGYQVFKVTLALVGGILGALFGHAAALGLGLGTGGAVIGMIVGGLLGAGLAFLLYKGAVFVAGFSFGITLGTLLLTHYSHVVASICGLVLGIIGGFLAVSLQRVLIIFATALLGSFRAVLGLAYFTSKLDWLYYYQQPQQIPVLIDSNNWMLLSIAGLAIVGALAQLGLGGSSSPKKGKSAE